MQYSSGGFFLATSLAALSLTLASLTACSSSGGGGGSDTVDAPPTPAVQMVDCTAAVTKEVRSIAANDYVPNPITVTAGTIVRFNLSDTPQHNARAAGLFFVDFGQNECVKFNTPGTYTFGCTSHGFVGRVIVQ